MNKHKTITFKYTGGQESITLNVMPYALPVTYVIDTNVSWLEINVEFTKVTFIASPTFDYVPRSAVVKLVNNAGSEIIVEVKQEGYDGIGLECDNNVVLTDSYFHMNEYYNFYITVYGGETQELVCNKLKPNIEKVWDNSDMYNTFIIKIPKNLNGKYRIKHSEYSKYKKYCQETGIPFDETKVMRDINIIHISENDIVGKMRLEYKDIIYETRSEIPVTVTSKNETEINIISTEYYHQISRTKYEIIDNKEVDLQNYPHWLSVRLENNRIILKANESNKLSPRIIDIRVTNRTNPHQYIDLLIKQESGT